MRVLIATGAYCRQASRRDWLEGKDFQIWHRSGGGCYFSIRDQKFLKQDGFSKIQFIDSVTGDILFTVEL